MLTNSEKAIEGMVSAKSIKKWQSDFMVKLKKKSHLRHFGNKSVGSYNFIHTHTHTHTVYVCVYIYTHTHLILYI